MAKSEEYARWIVANSNKKGTPEFDTVATAYKDSLSNSSGDAQSVKEPPKLNRFLNGAGGQTLKSASAISEMIPFMKDAGVTGALDKYSKEGLDKATGTAGEVGKFVGDAAPYFALPGGSALKAALQAAGLSAATTKGDILDRAGNAATTGALSAAGSGVAKTIPYIAEITKRAVAPFGDDAAKSQILARYLRSLSGDNTEAIAKRLENYADNIPGVKATAPQAVAYGHGGEGIGGGISSAFRAAEQNNPELYRQADIKNLNATADLMRSHAGDELSLQGLKGKRAVAAEPFYKSSDASIVPVDKQLADIIERLPKGTMSTAEDISRMNGGSLIKTHGMTPSSGYSFTNSTPTEISGKGINLIKQAIDDVVNTNPQASIGKNSKGAGLGVKEDLLSWADKNIPDYKTARGVFQEKSIPINQAEIAQAIYKKAFPAVTDFGDITRVTPQAFSQAIREGALTAKKTTGFSGATLKNTMSEAQLSDISAIAKYLKARGTAQESGRGVGSNTFQNFAMSDIAGASGMPGELLSSLTKVPMAGGAIRAAGGVLGAGVRAAYGKSQEEMKNILADALLDPKKTAALLRLTGPQSRIAEIMASQKLAGLPGKIGASVAQEINR
jgi:hypothetical protein